MAKRRPSLEPLEARLCMAAPTLQSTVSLPVGSWTATPYRASPIVADVNNDGKDDLISVASGAQLVAYGTGANGQLAPLVTYRIPAGVADIKATPVVVTNPATGRKALFAAMGRDEANSGSLEDGRVFGWDLQTGQLLPGWALGQSSGVNVLGQTGAYGPIASGDLDGDGVPEIVVTSFSHDVTAFRLDGSKLWSWTNDDTIVSGVVIGDIDRSGSPTVIVGGDSSSSAFFQNGGWVTALTSGGNLKWRHFIPGEVTWSSPTLADLQNNGTLDIVIGTGLNFDTSGIPGARAAGNYLYALDPSGNVLPGWPYHLTTNDAVAHQVLGSVAAADLLGNGQLDVVAIDRAGYLHAIAPNGQPLPGFAGGRSIAFDLPASNVPDDYASPIIADINGDGRPDIIAAAGPYLRAFDSAGNLLWSVTTDNVGGLPEGIDAAAAVGRMNGASAPGTLGFVSYNALNANRPDRLMLYQLPATSLTPPWPSQRRSATGEAVMRSAAFDRGFVAQAFQGAIGGQPDAATFDAAVDALDTNVADLYQTAQNIYSSDAARRAQILRAYRSILGHDPDPAAITFWTNYLASNSLKNLELQLIAGDEFAQVSGNTLAGEVGRLYQVILGRTAAPGEVDGWVNSGLPIAQIASAFFNGPEGTTNALNTIYTSAFGAGTQGNIAADTRAAFAFDYHRGAREEVIAANLVANGGNYAAANILASYTRDLYRDILHREGTPGEVANWVNSLDAGGVTVAQVPTLILGSTEARAIFIQQEFAALLGRSADQASVNALINYPTREALIVTLVGSPEYIIRNGGTIPSYIAAVARDLAAISPVPASIVADYTGRFNKGTPLTALAIDLISNPGLYFTQTAVTELQQYLPDESLGVLRSGNLPPTAAGQPINPNPGLISYLVGLSSVGVTDEQNIAILLSSSIYFGRITYNKGIYRGPGIRT